MDNLPLTGKNRSSITQLFHYALVGITTNLAGYMVYLLITDLGAAPKITMTLLYGVCAVIGFMGNRKLTFAYKGSLLGSGIRYIIAHCFGYLINLAILIVLVDKFGYAHQLVQATAILVVAVFLFMAFKFFVFTDMDVSNKRQQ
jgi:putative flippase GtrA